MDPVDSEFSERRDAIVEINPRTADGAEGEIVLRHRDAQELLASMQEPYASTGIRRNLVDSPVILKLRFRENDRAAAALQDRLREQPAEFQREMRRQRSRSPKGDIPRVASAV